jgi:hypothetical protein
MGNVKNDTIDRELRPLPEHGVEMYRLMPHATLAIFPGGHGGYMGEIATSKDPNTLPVALPVIEDFLIQ